MAFSHKDPYYLEDYSNIGKVFKEKNLFITLNNGIEDIQISINKINVIVLNSNNTIFVFYDNKEAEYFNFDFSSMKIYFFNNNFICIKQKYLINLYNVINYQLLNNGFVKIYFKNGSYKLIKDGCDLLLKYLSILDISRL